MKNLIFGLCLFFTTLVSAAEIVDDMRGLANTYEQAQIPDFLPYVGKPLPGRCILAEGGNKKMASVLMVSFEVNGFELAPFDAEKKRVDIFDHLTYEEILKQFPFIKKEFIEVFETADGAVIERSKGDKVFRGEIRESDKYMIMRVFINEKLSKYCNYQK